MGCHDAELFLNVQYHRYFEREIFGLAVQTALYLYVFFYIAWGEEGKV